MPLPTMVVETGSGGLHVYWCFNRALAVAEWQVLANALSEACKYHGLIIDHGVTVDCARVLRVSGTFNRKPQYIEPKRAVLGADIVPIDPSPEVIATALAKFMQVKSVVALGKAPVSGKFSAVWADGSKIDITRHPNLAGVPIINDLSAGIGRPRPTREAVALRCPWWNNTLSTGGFAQRNGEWRNGALRLSHFLADPLTTAVEASKGDPRFTLCEVTREMDRIRTDNAANPDLGPPLCKTIDLESQSKFCRQCPRWANTSANPKQSPLHTLPMIATVVDSAFSKKLAAARYRLHAFYKLGGADVQKSRRLAAQVIHELKGSDPLLVQELAPSLVMLLARQGSSPAYIQSSAIFCGLSSDNAASLTNWTFNTLHKEEKNHG